MVILKSILHVFMLAITMLNYETYEFHIYFLDLWPMTQTNVVVVSMHAHHLMESNGPHYIFIFSAPYLRLLLSVHRVLWRTHNRHQNLRWRCLWVVHPLVGLLLQKFLLMTLPWKILFRPCPLHRLYQALRAIVQTQSFDSNWKSINIFRPNSSKFNYVPKTLDSRRHAAPTSS